MNKSIYVLATAGCFVLGAYTWKVSHTGQIAAVTGSEAKAGERSPTVYVDGRPITPDDVDWEYQLDMSSVKSEPRLVQVPNLGPRYGGKMDALRQQILANLIERKVLYRLVERDPTFNLAVPERTESCLAEWRDILATSNPLFVSPVNQQRLKTSLCEKSVLDQYLREKVFKDIQISKAEIATYYKSHASDFKLPERVVVRQIVTANESEAKRLLGQVNRDNFAELARAHSITPEAAKGGLVGPFAKGEMVDLFDVAFTMQRGEISPILKSTYGFHIIMLERKMPKVDLSMAEATPRIQAILLKQKQDEDYKKWVELALNTVSVETSRSPW